MKKSESENLESGNFENGNFGFGKSELGNSGSDSTPAGQSPAPAATGGERWGTGGGHQSNRADGFGYSDLEIEELEFVPRGISWPREVYELDWPDGIPNWLETRMDVLYRIEKRVVGRGRNQTIETTRVPVRWFHPGWMLPGSRDESMPKPSLIPSRWVPNELPCCWWCGMTLFWVDADRLERCALCSPPPRLDWSFVDRWFLKPGFDRGFDRCGIASEKKRIDTETVLFDANLKSGMMSNVEGQPS